MRLKYKSFIVSGARFISAAVKLSTSIALGASATNDLATASAVHFDFFEAIEETAPEPVG